MEHILLLTCVANLFGHHIICNIHQSVVVEAKALYFSHDWRLDPGVTDLICLFMDKHPALNHTHTHTRKQKCLFFWLFDFWLCISCFFLSNWRKSQLPNWIRETKSLCSSETESIYLTLSGIISDWIFQHLVTRHVAKGCFFLLQYFP